MTTLFPLQKYQNIASGSTVPVVVEFAQTTAMIDMASWQACQ